MIIASMLALLLNIQDKPYEGELKERLRTPAKASFESNKASYDLEICVADAVTVLGVPTVLRDGPANIVIAAATPGGNAFPVSVTISPAKSGSHLDLRIKGKGWDDRIASRIRACL